MAKTAALDALKSWAGIGYFDEWRESAAIALIAAELQSGPFSPSVYPEPLAKAVERQWDENEERALAAALSSPIAAAVLGLRSKRHRGADSFSRSVAIIGRVVANAVTVANDSSGNLSAIALASARRRSLLSILAKRLDQPCLAGLATWARQSLLNSIAETQFVFEREFGDLILRLIHSLSPPELSRALTAEGALFRRSRTLGCSGGIGYVVASAWKNGVCVQGAIADSWYDWESASAILGTDVSRFAVEVNANPPKELLEALRIVACGPSSRTLDLQAQVIECARDSLANCERIRLLRDFQAQFAAVKAMPKLLHDRSWEADLYTAVSSVEPPPFHLWQARPETIKEREWQMRASRQEFANMIANHGGRIAVWRPLFRSWGVLDHVSVETGPWAEMAQQRTAAESIADVVKRLLVSDSCALPADIQRAANAASEDDPGIRSLFLGKSCKTDGSLRRRLWLFELILDAAPALSVTVLSMAACVTNSCGRGRASKALRRLVRRDAFKYDNLLESFPDSIRVALRRASHPVHSVAYLVDGKRLKRISQDEASSIAFQGRSPFLRGTITLLHLEGVGSSRKIDIVSAAYATDVQIDNVGNVASFTGTGFMRIAGHVRTLTATEAEMARYACRPCDSASDTAIEKATETVAEIVERANRELGLDGWTKSVIGLMLEDRRD